MPNPTTVRERRLRKTKAQLIDEIDTLEQRATALEAATRSGTPMRAKASGRYLADRELADLARFPSENPNPVLRVMPDGTVLYANGAARAVNGLLKGRKKSTLARGLKSVVAKASRTAEVRETEFESGDRIFAFSIAPVTGKTYINIYGRDITREHAAKRELAAKEAQLRVALDSMPGGMMLGDRDLNYVLFNSQYIELFDFPDGLVSFGGSFRDELRYQADRGDFGPGDKDDLVEQVVATYQRGEAVSYEREIAGTGRTLQGYLAPTPEGGYVTIVNDITGRKRAEEALRESEEQVRLLLNSTAEAIYGIDLEGNCSFANPACAEMLGYDSAEDLLGEHIHDLIHHTRHDGTPYPAEECLIYQAVVRGEGTHVEDEVLWRQDGTSFPAEYWSYPIKRDDRVIGAVVTFLDITERKRMEEALRLSEQRYALAMAAVNEGVYDWNVATDEIYYSPRVIATLGFSEAELRTAQDWSDRIHPDDLPEYQARMRAHFKGENERFEHEFRYRGVDGSWRWARQHGLSLRDETGRVYRMAGSTGDITEEKRLEAALEAARRQLSEAIEAISEGFVLFDAEDRIVLCNERYRRFFREAAGEDVASLVVPGASFESFLRAAFEKGMFPDTGEDVDSLVARRARERQDASSPSEIYLANGSWLQSSERRTQDGGLVAVYTEITEVKQREAELAEKEAQLRVALDHMPGGMTLGDRDLNYVLFNSQYSELCEFPDGLVRVGVSLREVLRYQAERGDYGPGDKDDLIEEVVATYQRGEAVSYERAIAGSGRTLQIDLAPTPEGGYVTIFTDITEHKRAEAALQEAYGIIKDQRDRMEDELNIGREIQMSMIPLVFPPFPDHSEFSVFAALEPAREVGGDFYDYYFIDEERFCFCIGDVSGKGVPAALFMAMARTLIKSRAADDRSTASILTHVNDELSVDNNNCMFVTIFSGILNIRTGELLYTNAGHNPPYLKRKDGTLQCLDQRHGPVIGAVEGMVYAEGRDTMEPGDLLLLYTDGVTEAMDLEDRLFSEHRLEQLLTSMDTNDADKVIDNTMVAVKDFAGEAEQADDITILALAFHGSPEDPLNRVREGVVLDTRRSAGT